MSDQPPSSQPSVDRLAPGTSQPSVAPLVPGSAVVTDPSAAATQAMQANKDKKKLRGAWISFVSRIIAQFVGSAATIVLGLIVLHEYQTSNDDKAGTGQSAPATERVVTPVRERVKSEHATVAVLPLDNFSGDPKQDHLANAMTEELITALSQVEGLRVISRTSSMHYKGATKPLPEIARELAVEWIVEGSVTPSNGRVRVIGQLIETSSDEHIWAASYERRLQDALSLQAGLASVMAREVGSAIARGKAVAGKVHDPALSGSDRLVGEGLDHASPDRAETSDPNSRP